MDTREPMLAELLGQTDQLRLNFGATHTPVVSEGDGTITSEYAIDLPDRRSRRFVLTVHQDRLSHCVLAYRLHPQVHD